MKKSKPRYFVKCHLLQLKEMMRAENPMKYAKNFGLVIIDGRRERHFPRWRAMMNERESLRHD